MPVVDPRRSSRAALGHMPVSVQYNPNCMHGGPPVSVIQHLVPKLQFFQTAVFQHQSKYRDVQSLARLLAAPQFAELMSPHLARVLLSEAVDCYARSDDMAHHWFCAGILISASVQGSWQFKNGEIPQQVLNIVAESEGDFAVALWRWTSCSCMDAPVGLSPWKDAKSKAVKLVTKKQWQRAITSFQQVLGMLNTAEDAEGRKMRATCLSSRSPQLLRQISEEVGRVQCNISMCHMSLGEASKALAAADLAIAAHPRLAKAHARRALALESLGQPAWTAADTAVFVAEANGEDAEAYKSIRQRFSPSHVSLQAHKNKIGTDSWGKLLETELVVGHGTTCFLEHSSLMALRAICRCGHAVAAVSIRQLSVAGLLRETQSEVRDKVQAFIKGSLPPSKFAQSLLSLVNAEANQERQIQLLQAVSLFDGGLRSDHAAFTAAAATWWRNSPSYKNLALECWLLPEAASIFANILSRHHADFLAQLFSQPAETDSSCDVAMICLFQRIEEYLEDVTQEIERSIEDIDSGETDQITLGLFELHASGLHTQILHLLAEGPVAALTKALLGSSKKAKFAKVMSAERPLLHRQLRDTMLLETMSMCCFELPRRYCAAVARKCPDSGGMSSDALAENMHTLPEPVKGVLEFSKVYNTSCFLDLQFPGLADELDMAVWLSEDRAARWRAALHILSKKLRPSLSAILYLHGIIAGQMLDTGFYEVFARRDSLSDMLVLNVLCLERGGIEGFMRWTSTFDGLCECIENFQDLRSSIITSHRELLVHHNEEEAFSYAYGIGIPHFD